MSYGSIGNEAVCHSASKHQLFSFLFVAIEAFATTLTIQMGMKFGPIKGLLEPGVSHVTDAARGWQ
jgi:hypothetical protein